MSDTIDPVLAELLNHATSLSEFLVNRKLNKVKPAAQADREADTGALPEAPDLALGIAALSFLIDKGELDLGGYSAWIDVAIALKNSFGEDGFRAWLAFSEAADGFESEDDCRYVWDGIAQLSDEENRRTIATYFMLAQQCGWARPKGGGGGKSGNADGEFGAPGKGEDLTAYAVSLVEAAGDELWSDAEGKPHATYIETLPDGKQVRRHLPITGSEYHAVLNARFFRAAEQRRTLKPDQAAGAAAILAMKAKRSGVTYPTFLRAGEQQDTIYVDLGDASGRAAAINAAGWTVIEDPPVRFVRGSRSALPVPERGGSLADIQKHFNLDPDDLKRAVGFMVGTFNTAGSYSILITDGEQGSCKSTMNDKVLGLTDPPQQPKSARMSFNAKEQDLHILAQGAHVLSFDNVSMLTADAADALCRVATGGASGSRQLYTNDGFTQFVVQRPVILTCIGVPSTRADLLDRSIRIQAQPVEVRRTEKAVQAAFDRDRPKLLGFLFDCVAAALAQRPKVEEAIENGSLKLPRMADFASFVEGAHEMLGLEMGGFSRLLTEGQAAMQIESARGDVMGEALIAYFSRMKTSSIDSSATELLARLKACLPDGKHWPAPNGVNRKLQRIAVGLRKLGIEFDVTEASGHDNVAKYRIWTTAAFQPQVDDTIDDMDAGGGHF